MKEEPVNSIFFDLFIWYNYGKKMFFTEYTKLIDFRRHVRVWTTRGLEIKYWHIKLDENGVSNKAQLSDFLLDVIGDSQIPRKVISKYMDSNFKDFVKNVTFEKITPETFLDLEEMYYISSVNNSKT